jgi:hypothetical protein
MFKIEGDHCYISTYAQNDYSTIVNGQSGIKMQISLMPRIVDLLKRCERMEQEWQEQKRLIESNPAVKASYEQYQQMIQLAKEYPDAA